MADRPIIFSGPMVRALLAGRKTQTRRILKPQPPEWRPGEMRWRVGDRLWVREHWSGLHAFQSTKPNERHSFVGDGYPYLREEIWYWADGAPDAGDWEHPRPSLHMPRYASRLTLTVTDIRVQRVQDISGDDARAEGIYWSGIFEGWTSGVGVDESVDFHQRLPVRCFEKLWRRINGNEAWDTNPWIAALTFAVEQRNIDA